MGGRRQTGALEVRGRIWLAWLRVPVILGRIQGDRRI